MKKLVVTTIIMLLMLITLQRCVIGAVAARISTSVNNLKEGEQLEITVFFEEKVAVAQFNLEYDTDKFEYIENSQKADFTKEYKYFAYVSSDGRKADLSEVKFIFKAKKEGTANFSINNVKVSTETQKKVLPSILVGNVSVEVQKIDNTTENKPNETVTSNNISIASNIPNSANTSNTNQENRTENINNIERELNEIDKNIENDLLQEVVQLQGNIEEKPNILLYILLVVLTIIIIIAIIIIVYKIKNNK